MTIVEQVRDGVVQLELAGRMDFHARSSFMTAVDQAAQSKPHSILMNFSDVTFIDSAALGGLVLAQRRFQRIGGKLGIIAPMGFVRDILELTEIHEWIPIFTCEDEAWKSFEGQGDSTEAS